MLDFEKQFHFRKVSDHFLIKPNFAEDLCHWGQELGSQISAGGFQGSLSYRHGLGFVMTRKGCDESNLKSEDLVFVESCELSSPEITYCGKGEPSFEGLIHALVYQNRSGAIFSFFVDILDLPERVTSQQVPCLGNGKTVSFATFSSEMEKSLGTGNCLRIPGQGLLSFGCTSEDAGGQILKLFKPS